MTITTKIIDDTREEIAFSVTIGGDYDYLVEASLIEDSNIFSIRVYDTIRADVNPYNANEVMNGLFVSDGGSFNGFEVELNLEEGNNQQIINLLEDTIIKKLFNKKNGLLTKYNY